MKIFVGYDTREDIAYQVCEYSAIKHSNDVEVIPLNQNKLRQDKWYWRGEDKLASTEFTFTRFLVPALANYKGWALFCDSDIVFLKDIKELFDQANASELNYALLDIRLGNYDKAARYFKNNNSYNAVLAKILNGNNDVKCDEKTADCYYLNAISHARSGNENLTIKSLKKAIELNPEYKRDAKIDLEFVNFRNSETFNNTIN